MAIFLSDSGSMSMGNKTPVTILYETLNRKGIVADYELIYNGVGTVDPIFKYRVSALGFTAIGDGKTKKEAKHDAAASLLRKMQSSKPEADDVQAQLPEDEDIASPYFGSLKENCIGTLEDICVVNQIPLAVFRTISEVGPPHARIFTIECKLSSCTEVAVARTKKQAKHIAAHQMINRVMEILGDKFVVPTEDMITDFNATEETSFLKSIEDGTFQHDISTSLANVHNVFHDKQQLFRVPEEFFKISFDPLTPYDQLENPKQYLKDLVQKLEGICKTTVVSNTSERGASPAGKDTASGINPDKKLKKITDACVKSQISSSQKESCDLLMKKFGLMNFFDDDSSQPTLDEVAGDSGELVQAVEEPLDVKTTHEDLKVMIFLTIVCPKGEYVFSAIASDLEAAERQAAVEALKFLRIMSLPRDSAELHRAAHPLQML